MRPAVEAIAKRHRVLSFSLCDERSSPFPCDLERGFENYIDQTLAAMDRAGIEKATIAGVSYGGLIASEFAARHPGRVTTLVLASALHSDWQPDGRQRQYLKSPWLMSPLFVATAPGRMRPEMSAAFPGVAARLRFMASHGVRCALAPTSPAKMARRIAWAATHRFADLRAIASRALIVTGERALDRVVPVDVSERYMAQLQSAEHVVLEHTGHLGIVTRPELFAEVIGRFLSGKPLDGPRGRSVGTAGAVERESPLETTNMVDTHR
jgi:pimeloyl-ACP methyl ester carboxylesterase